MMLNAATNGSNVVLSNLATSSSSSTLPLGGASELAAKLGDTPISLVLSQTLSPAGSVISSVSSDEESRKRRFSDIQEEEKTADETVLEKAEDEMRLQDGLEQQEIVTEASSQSIENNERLKILATPVDAGPKLLLKGSTDDHHIKSSPVTLSTPTKGNNDLNIIEYEANEILRQVNESIQKAEQAMDSLPLERNSKELVEGLVESLHKSKSLILKLNLSKNLFKFQINSELEQHNIEKQILIRNLETFRLNLNTLLLDNNTLTEKNMRLIKYYKNLKYGKFKELKNKNSRLSKKLELYKSHIEKFNLGIPNGSQSQASQMGLPSGTASSSASSSGRNSLVLLNRQQFYQQSQSQQSSIGGGDMLNTLGMLASQVLANEEQPNLQGQSLPPTFGNNEQR